MNIFKIAAIITAVITSSVSINASDDNSKSVFIISPANGAVIHGPVHVVFGIKGMALAPAGTDLANSGHHHLIIDAPLPDMTMNIPADEHHIHFGKAQTETTVQLSPGKHTIQLLLGDMNHMPHAHPVTSKVVTITVVE